MHVFNGKIDVCVCVWCVCACVCVCVCAARDTYIQTKKGTHVICTYAIGPLYVPMRLARFEVKLSTPGVKNTNTRTGRFRNTDTGEA